MRTAVENDVAGAADPRQGADLSGSTRRRHTTRWVAVSVLVVTAGLVAVLATRPQAANQASSALVGQPAPGIDAAPEAPLQTVTGSSFLMSSLLGHWVVVNFFASWCVPCQDEAPQLVAFSHEHATNGTNGTPGSPVLLGIAYDDSAGNARSFMRSTGADWTAVMDSGNLKIAYGVTGPPETFVVTPEGTVLAHYIGPVTAAALNQVIADGEASGY
jgi:cytochrome c biogenesis protein CcmG, thiol:disulfide interchange protein DsbE